MRASCRAWFCTARAWEPAPSSKTMVDSAGTPFKNQGDCVSYYATGEKNLAN